MVIAATTKVSRKKTVTTSSPAAGPYRVAAGEGAVASTISPELALRRAVLACMLWEDIAYENGASVVDNIRDLVKQVDPQTVASIAVEAREKQKLRHVPLMLVREMARLDSHKGLVASTLDRVIARPDEISEFLALYWKEKKEPLSNQVKKGLAKAFRKFDEYQISKYAGNKKSSIKLRDALFLVHAKPQGQDQVDLWKKLANRDLTSPDTWEVALSEGKGTDKKETWERLVSERKLGAMALLRNLRNMIDAGVDEGIIRQALVSCKADKVLPFRFIAAEKEAPKFRGELETLMLSCLKTVDKIKGKTIVVVDVSGSMKSNLSGKSNMNRQSAAMALAMLIKGVSEECIVYATAGNDCSREGKSERISDNLKGFALADAIERAARSLGGGGIFLKHCVDYAAKDAKTADTRTVLVMIPRRGLSPLASLTI